MKHAAAPDDLAANTAFAPITTLLDASNAAYTLHEHALIIDQHSFGVARQTFIKMRIKN